MKLEVLEKDKYYHIYNKGINGTSIFSNEENKRYFLQLASKYLIEKASIYAYCLMDNHFHFVVQILGDEKEVTQAFSNLFNAYAKAYNKQQNRSGSLFEKHFKRINLPSEVYLKNLIVYVHLNPKNHLNVDFKTYTFSSYQTFLSDKTTNLPRAEVIRYFENIENFIFCHESKNNLIEEKYSLE
jgi:putative transposase